RQADLELGDHPDHFTSVHSRVHDHHSRLEWRLCTWQTVGCQASDQQKFADYSTGSSGYTASVRYLAPACESTLEYSRTSLTKNGAEAESAWPATQSPSL